MLSMDLSWSHTRTPSSTFLLSSSSLGLVSEAWSLVMRWCLHYSSAAANRIQFLKTVMTGNNSLDRRWARGRDWRDVATMLGGIQNTEKNSTWIIGRHLCKYIFITESHQPSSLYFLYIFDTVFKLTNNSLGFRMLLRSFIIVRVIIYFKLLFFLR